MSLWFVPALLLSFGQDKARPTDPIVTDRPDFTESSVVVPLRWFQIESGLTYQRVRGGSLLSGPELLFRYGLTERTELRLGLPDYGRLNIDGDLTTGFGDTYVGIKYQLGPAKNGDDWALIPAVSLPSHRDPLSSGSVDPELKVCWSRDLGGKWALSMMAYGLWTADGFVFQPTASFGRELSPRLGMFLEYAGTFQKDGIPDHIAHAGLAYRLNDNCQIDVHGGFSLNSSDRAPFLAAGYSVRF